MADGHGQTAYTGETAPEVPGYRIERRLGQGSMGVVYLAEDIQLRRKVALKVLTPALAEDELFRKRFDRESQSAATLDHPNIVPVYAAGQAGGLLYIAMRYVRGGDLRTLLETQGPLSLGQASSIIAAVAEALDAAHAQGMIHRDVKPANILIDDHAGQQHYYLSDFGITKNISADRSLTSAGQVIGTIDYIAPEHIQGKAVDARADLYALGCVLYQCLTAVVPFPRQDTAALMWAHVHDEPPSVTTLRPELPPAVDQIVATALAKQPEDRYPTCRDLALALRAIPPTEDQHSTAVPAPPTGDSPPPPGTTSMTSTYTPPVVEPAQAPEAAPARSRRKWWWIAAGVLTLALAAGATVGVMAYLRAQFPNTAEKNLLQQVPLAVRNSCARAPVAEVDAPTVQAAVTCPSTGDGPSTVSFTKYASPQALDSHYQAAAANSGDGRLDVGDCANTDRAERPYTDSSGRKSGRILCYQELGSSIVTWTDGRTLTLATATRLDGDYPKVRDWWANVMGLPTRAQREQEAKAQAAIEEERKRREAVEQENKKIQNDQAEKDKRDAAERERLRIEKENERARQIEKDTNAALEKAKADKAEADRIARERAQAAQNPPAESGGQQGQGPPTLPTPTLSGSVPPAPGPPQGSLVAGSGGCTPRAGTFVCTLTQQAPVYRPGATDSTESLSSDHPAGFLCQMEGPTFSAGNLTNRWWAWANLGNTEGWIPTVFLSGRTDNGQVPGLAVCSRGSR